MILPASKLRHKLSRARQFLDVIEEAYPDALGHRYHKDRGGTSEIRPSGTSDPTGDAVADKESIGKDLDRAGSLVEAATKDLDNACGLLEHILGRDVYHRTRRHA